MIITASNMEKDSVVNPLQLNLNGDFDTQVNNVLQMVRLTRKEVDDLKKLFIDLERSLQHVWQGCRVMPFGSIVTGLGIKSSDVDCFVYVPDEYDHDQVKLVLTARKIMRKRPMVFYQPFAITTAKVPIVKFFHIPTRCNCDVSFKSPSGVRNSKLIAYLLHIDKRALPFTILIKYWSKVHKLTGTNLIPNYALTMLSIFFLQQKTILPPVVRLQSSNNSFYVDGWNTAFNEKCNNKTDNNQSLYELVGEFFQYYSSFNFEENVVSTFVGFPVPKSHFKDSEIVPSEFDIYKRNFHNEDFMLLKVETKMCVQDPFEHNRNCTAAVFPALAHRFTLHVQLASQIYEDKDSSNFLKQVLLKKPFIPKKNKRNRKNKNLPQTQELANNIDQPQSIYNEVLIDEKDEADNPEICSGSQASIVTSDAGNENVIVSDEKATEDSAFVPNDIVISSASKRSSHNVLADEQSQTKRQKM